MSVEQKVKQDTAAKFTTFTIAVVNEVILIFITITQNQKRLHQRLQQQQHVMLA